MEKKHEFIINDFFEQLGTQESVRVYSITSVATGETEAVIDIKISGRYPIQKLEEVLEMAKIATSGGGRQVVSVDDLISIYKNDKSII